MTQGELKRLHVIHKALDKLITQAEAAGIIGICLRQAQRIVKAVKAQGDKGVIHKSRGQASNRALPDKIKDKALKLYQEKYHDFGPTLGAEKLLEIDKIKINDETLRLWLLQAGISYKKRKARPHRQWRERKHSFGEMIQMDGSHHDWFEGRGPECVLMGYIDDATGRPFGRFYSYEGTLPAMGGLKRYIEKFGIPVSVYLDKHPTHKSTKKQDIEDELNNLEPLSQFERASEELGIRVIHADSPQAKGRIERLFKTFQNRLIKEMRLKGIKTIEEANKLLMYYLPAYAKRFAVQPANNTDLHRPVTKSVDLNAVFCVKTIRVLRNDFTVAHNSKLYQIENNLNAKKVMVEERANSSIHISYKSMDLKFKEITTRPKKQQKEPQSPKIPDNAQRTAAWRRFRLPGSIKFEAREEALAGVL
ncbi:MAG: ISNCY family transposase [Candidatus Omnitrophica bacterium CG11_big_fil_rev_8_21_14_0_20_41_12]|nr:MAG: ISNCY family transposase [Candidatus Omnitrophica bacterium CG11_big_fil_rev_8_21_14_0_20_41_12]